MMAKFLTYPTGVGINLKEPLDVELLARQLALLLVHDFEGKFLTVKDRNSIFRLHKLSHSTNLKKYLSAFAARNAAKSSSLAVQPAKADKKNLVGLRSLMSTANGDDNG